jgi:AraC-like DNA-binding protein
MRDEQFEGAAEESSSQPLYHAARRQQPRRVHDRLHVDLSQDWEVQLWTRHFQCSEAELRRAVHGACNNEVGEVGAYLRRHRS